MNATVAKIVDLLFQDTEMTQEAQAMHDELMTNCQDRFDDLVSHGKSEDDAIGGVIESLKGMEEVIGAYPKKQNEPVWRNSEAGGESFDNDEGDEDERVVRIPAEGLRCIDFDARGYDLTCNVTGGSDVIVRYERTATLDVQHDGDCLRITSGKSGHINVTAEGTDLFSALRGFFTNLGAELGTCEVEVSVPRSLALKLVARTVSGDIEAEGLQLTEADIVTTSGDIDLTAPADWRADKLSVSTASGDVDVEGNAEEIWLKTMSGDLDATCDCERLTVASVSGDVDVTARCEKASLKSVSGDVELHCPAKAPSEVSAVSTSGDIYLYLPESTAGVDLQTNTVSGSIRQNVPHSREAGVPRVKAQTVSGDVQVSCGR